MLGVIVNTFTVILGSTVGLVFKRFIPKSIGDRLLQVLGLCSVYIGIEATLKSTNALIVIISSVIGTLIGEALKLDDRINSGLEKIENKFNKNKSEQSITSAFINACVVFCIGSMTMIGCLNAGLTSDNTVLYTKSTLDLFSSCVFSSTMGIGVLFSSIFVFVFQGALVLLSGILKNILTQAVITEIAAVGGISILAIGLNLAGISKFKVINMLPSIIIAPVICILML